MPDGPPGELDMLAVAQPLAGGVDLVGDAPELRIRAILGGSPAGGVVVHRVSSVDTALRTVRKPVRVVAGSPASSRCSRSVIARHISSAALPPGSVSTMRKARRSVGCGCRRTRLR